MHKNRFFAHTMVRKRQEVAVLNWLGIFPGFINGLLGTGGGILAVSLLNRQSNSPQEAHATAVGLMLPLSTVSFLFSLFQSSDILQYWPLFLPAAAGSFTGAFLLKRISPRKLRLLFALLILYSAVRILSS